MIERPKGWLSSSSPITRIKLAKGGLEGYKVGGKMGVDTVGNRLVDGQSALSGGAAMNARRIWRHPAAPSERYTKGRLIIVRRRLPQIFFHIVTCDICCVAFCAVAIKTVASILVGACLHDQPTTPETALDHLRFNLSVLPLNLAAPIAFDLS